MDKIKKLIAIHMLSQALKTNDKNADEILNKMFLETITRK
jgi:hypothetical protein